VRFTTVKTTHALSSRLKYSNSETSSKIKSPLFAVVKIWKNLHPQGWYSERALFLHGIQQEGTASSVRTT
jgi:hypothetical protein